ncbi:hypothetical protein KIN20_012750 [Parelaphostrongylus tenuis]|uniref:SCP domain-containing protein n=1 Tax=Parelaphostrongylus tenuis TaxID=148309 RepID=A0AAD5MTR2_PARTN|nr:hypothetical protein KIN20_012750 [Parelaphostrongylus tenuis]
MHGSLLRIHLANGTHNNGNGDSAGNFPQASDMSLVEYDCGLEKLAFDISQLCHNESHPNFTNVGSNIAVYSGNVKNFESNITDLIMRWWNTSIENPHLVNLTSTLNDTGMIPFLQMANANTTKVGCAYSVCDHTPHCPTRPPYVVFVCQYGQS